MEYVKSGNYWVWAVACKMKTRSWRHRAFSLYLPLARFNYAVQATFHNNYNCLPWYKASFCLETNTLGRSLGRLLKYHLMRVVASRFVLSAVYRAPTVCPGLPSAAGGSVWMNYGLLLPIPTSASIYLFISGCFLDVCPKWCWSRDEVGVSTPGSPW